MSSLLADTLAKTAACAATLGRLYWPQSVIAALEHGKRAAQHGCCLPLPALLDVWAILESPRFLSQVFRRGRTSHSQAIVDYDDWLATFCTMARRYLGRRGGRNTQSRFSRSRDSQGTDCLHLLIHVWPQQKTSNNKQTPVEWAKAYTALLTTEEHIQGIHQFWSGDRDMSDALWQTWWPGQKQGQRFDPRPSVMWGLFSLAVGPDYIHEQFDHSGAQLYLSATDPQLLPDQIRRIRRLRQRRREHISVPFWTSVEEQDPYYGKTALWTLCSGIYGEYKLVNGTDPKISNPPSPLPPRTMHIHLSWAHGYAGLITEHVTKVNRQHTTQAIGLTKRPDAEEMRTAYASILQGCVALLLDDWRDALKGLPVQFYLHRGWPNPVSVSLGKGGERWKYFARHRNPHPPESMVGVLFERHNHVALAATDAAWEIDQRAAFRFFHWWCGCALSCDLPEFGFVQQARIDRTTVVPEPTWVACASTLPGEISHLIVVDSPLGGSIYEVRRQNVGNQIELWPMPQRYGLSTSPDAFFSAVRCQALDLLLSAVERMS